MSSDPETPRYRASGRPARPSDVGEPVRVPRRAAEADARRRAVDRDGRRRATAASREPGLPGWAAVLLLIVIAGIGGLIDAASGSSVKGAFNYALVLASLVAILAVKRSQMFGVVIAPPLVYFAASAALLYIRSGGLHNRGKLYDAATNWIVYGFPAIAGATAAVLVVAGIRVIIRR